MPRFTAVLPLLIASLALTACEGDETGPSDHTPADAKLYNAAGQELTPNVSLPTGTSRVEVRFVDDHGHVIEGLEAGHYTSLTFVPALASTTPVTGQRFFIDVTVQAPSGTTGSVTIGYGHTPAADELTFGPFPVTIQ